MTDSSKPENELESTNQTLFPDAEFGETFQEKGSPMMDKGSREPADVNLEELFTDAKEKIVDGKSIDTLLEQNNKLASYADNDGITLLHLAAQYGRAGTVQTLLTLGANINAINNLS